MVNVVQFVQQQKIERLKNEKRLLVSNGQRFISSGQVKKFKRKSEFELEEKKTSTLITDKNS